MPVHRFEVQQPAKQVLNADLSVTVYSDGMALGELLISRGSIEWRPAGRQKTSRWTWEQFAQLMERS